ncbi:MAG: hypothetical protein ACYS8Z_25865 [Planctomycetota bacterium]
MEDKSNRKVGAAFVIMPFDESYDEIYSKGIEEVVEEKGYRCTRVEEQYLSGQIIDAIRRNILESDIIIAEMTDRNPNVYYEVGYAHGVQKYPILLTKDAGQLPFDVDGYQRLVYEGSSEVLRTELGKRLDWLETTEKAMTRIRRDPFRLRSASKALLTYLYQCGEDRPAAECIEQAGGIFGILKDVRFLGYVRYYGTLLASTPVHLTEDGKRVAKELLEQKEE